MFLFVLTQENYALFVGLNTRPDFFFWKETVLFFFIFLNIFFFFAFAYLAAYGLSFGMWHLSSPLGIKPAAPALQGRVSTTGL